VQTATQHTLGKAHRKNGGAPVARAVSADMPAGGGEKQLYLPSELELLPGYVDVWNGSLWCSLCTSKAGTLQSMVDHLCGQKHSKACRKSGRPELVFVETKQCFEELETGRAVRREDDDFEEFIPSTRRSLSVPRNGGVHACPTPLRCPSPALLRGRLHAPMEMNSKRMLSRERAQPKDERLVDIEPVAQVTPKDAATAQAWSNWSGRAKTRGRQSRDMQPQQSARTRSVDWVLEYLPMKPEVKTRGEDEQTIVLVDIAGTPPGWIWDPSTCLFVSKGEQVAVLHDEGEWVYAGCRGLEGWLPSSAIGPALRPDQRCSDETDISAVAASTTLPAMAAKAAPPPPQQVDCSSPVGTEVRCLFKSGIPATWEWDTSTVMQLDAGDIVQVLVVDGDWVYGRSGQREGWLPKSAVGLG